MTNQKILVIEDNRDNYELVRFLLEREGYEVVAAFDGVSGLKMAYEEKPDLILLDLAIPEKDGWQVAKELKSNPDTETMLIVALTAHTLPADKRKALESGCDGFISKPINVVNFTDQVSEILTTNLPDK